jgi:hypothetical protein
LPGGFLVRHSKLANDHDPRALNDLFTADHGMSSASHSRWTMPHVAVALSTIVAAQVTIGIGWTYPAASASAFPTLAVVHRLTDG